MKSIGKRNREEKLHILQAQEEAHRHPELTNDLDEQAASQLIRENEEEKRRKQQKKSEEKNIKRLANGCQLRPQPVKPEPPKRRKTTEQKEGKG